MKRDGAEFRAAWFSAGDVEAVTAAAATMKLRALPFSDETGRSLAQQLSAGRVLPIAWALPNGLGTFW